jgi:hypothetical protein
MVINLKRPKGGLGMATRKFEIYYRNLNKETQRMYLEFSHVESASELNHEVEPLAIIEVDDEEDTSIKKF